MIVQITFLEKRCGNLLILCYLTLIFLSYISNFIYLFREFNSLDISILTECTYNGKVKHEIQSQILSRKTKTTNQKG